MKTFENWYTNILEEVATAPVKSLAGDVDTIINSLDTLVKELTEKLNTMPIEEAETTDFISAWITSIRASSAQKKVNKIKMNSLDLEFAAKKAEGDKKKVFQDKSDTVKDQAKELQKMVDDRFSGKGVIVDRKIARAKIEGQLELIKRTSGMEDDPDRKSDLKTKMKELADRYKEEVTAISKLEDENKDEIEAEKERLRQEAENKKNEPRTEDTPDQEEPTQEEPTQEDPKVAEAKKKIKEYQEGIDALNAKDKKTKDDEDKISMLKAGIASEQKKIDKAQQQESLVTRANTAGLNELATEIASKQDWQLDEGTVLYQKYDAIIKKAEYSNSLNESRYQNLSVKDRFSRLL
jgi:myosin heavy subunit